jgi:hypothetical protein
MLLAGQPGATHDSAVFRTSSLFKEPEEYLSMDEYLLGDVAYPNGHYLVTPFKGPKNRALNTSQKQFNQRLSSIRVV